MRCAKCGKLIGVNELVVAVSETYRSVVTGNIEIRPFKEAYAHLWCPGEQKAFKRYVPVKPQ